MDAERTNVLIDIDNTRIYQSDKSLEDNDAWFKRLNRRVAETEWQGHHRNMYRVPCEIRMTDPAAYTPKILSLGTYHHGKPHLIAMDKLKWHYLRSFLRRNPQKRLEDYLNLMVEMEEKTREAYSEVPQMESKYWAEMMLLDSCFTMELLLKEFSWMFEVKESIGDDEVVDPIQSTLWVRPLVLGDMLLLENQLPFFLLNDLYMINSPFSGNSHSLTEIVHSVFKNMMPGKIRKSSPNSTGDFYHILHLLYSFTLPGYDAEIGCDNNISNLPSSPSLLPWLPSVNILKDAGVAFRVKRRGHAVSFMDITFQNETLEIPRLQINRMSNSVFRNLIAFEQCHTRNGSPTYWEAYAHLMDCIINTPADVALLQQEGIIITLGNDDDIAGFFNRLGTNAMMFHKSYLSGVFRDVHLHCDQRANKWKASLNHNYFKDPWTIIWFVAGIFPFTQTVLAFLSYIQSRSP